MTRRIELEIDMSPTTSTKTRRPSRTSTRETKKPRTLAVLPFALGSSREELHELEHVLVYGVQELFGFIGRVHLVDLAPCYSPDELEEKGRSKAAADVRELLKTADASALLAGEIDVCVADGTYRIESASIHVELRLLEGRKVDVLPFDFHVKNIADPSQHDRFELDVEELLQIQRQIFETAKKRLAWRYLAGPDRKNYYKYRLRNPMTRSYDAYRYFVRARRLSTRREEKLVYYKKAISHDECLGQAHRNIGYLYKESKKLNTAVQYYRQAVRHLIDSETLADAYAELGLCHANMNQVEEAIRCWQVSRRWNRANKDVYANLAIGYEEKGLIDKAVRYFRHAQRLDSNYYWACRGLGRIYAGKQDWAAAIEQLSIQLKIAPEDAWGHYTLGNCYYQEGNPTKARSHCRRAVELDPHGDAGRRAFQLLMEIDE